MYLINMMIASFFVGIGILDDVGHGFFECQFDLHRL